MIDKKEVRRLANLARIEIGKEEEEKLPQELSSILDYIEVLKEADVSLVDNVDNLIETPFLREDEVFKTETPELKEQFLDKEKGYLKVKPILKND